MSIKKSKNHKRNQSYVSFNGQKVGRPVGRFDAESNLLHNPSVGRQSDRPCPEEIVQEFKRPPSLLDHIRAGLIDLEGENLNIPIVECPDGIEKSFLFGEDIVMLTDEGEVRPLTLEEAEQFGFKNLSREE